MYSTGTTARLISLAAIELGTDALREKWAEGESGVLTARSPMWCTPGSWRIRTCPI